jgi:hypothetical protein
MRAVQCLGVTGFTYAVAPSENYAIVDEGEARDWRPRVGVSNEQNIVVSESGI